MTVLFWDIDGTLLTTAKGGVPAWEQAVNETTKQAFELSQFRIAGLTDYQIAVRTFEHLGVDASEDTLQKMVQRYEALLPTYLPQRRGHVMPQVREILESLRGRDEVRSYLLTGNTRGGAKAKLTHYDLWHFFPDGAFAEDARDRSTIAVRAMALARRVAPVSDDRVFVIGDTPHDIDCANAIGVRTIAVATGGYTLAELEAHGAWRVLEQLPPPGEFLALIGATRPEPDAHSPA